MNKEKADILIRKAHEIVTMQYSNATSADEERRLGIIEDGAIAIHNGKIMAVDKTRKIDKAYTAEKIIDASGQVVMPGFIDSHTHLLFAGSREEEFKLRVQGASYLETLQKGGGILETVRQTRKATRHQLIENGKQTLKTMMKHGTTTVEAKSGYGLRTHDEIKCLEAAKELNSKMPIDIVSTFLGAHAIPSEYQGNTDEYVNVVVEEMIPKVADRKLAEFCDVFCERGVFDVEQSRRILNAGKEYSMKPKLHADELTRSGGAELAAEIGAISAEHLVFASDKGLEAMAGEKVSAILLPAASFSLMNGRYADARKMLKLGVPVALGTDYNPSCWTENMQMVIALACRHCRLTPAEAIAAATIEAASAVGRNRDVGSLEKGKKADMVIFNIPNHKFLGYRFGVNLAQAVVKEGEIVIDNSKEEWKE